VGLGLGEHRRDRANAVRRPPSSTAIGSPRRLTSSSAGGFGTEQVAMARLEDEFRHVLSSRALDALADLGSLSISTTWCQLEDASRRPQLPTWPVQGKSPFSSITLAVFSGLFLVIFDSRVLLDLLVNFFLDLLILDVANLLLKSRFDSWCIEQVFWR